MTVITGVLSGTILCEHDGHELNYPEDYSPAMFSDICIHSNLKESCRTATVCVHSGQIGLYLVREKGYYRLGPGMCPLFMPRRRAIELTSTGWQEKE